MTIADRDELTAIPAPDWVFLEVMGHRSHYGLLTEVDRFGAKMARIDVFGAGETEPRETHLYSGSSIFSITPATEEKCRMAVSRWDPKPALLTHEPGDGLDEYYSLDVAEGLDEERPF